MEAPDYVPPDPTCIDVSDTRAIDYWAKTLETAPEKLREAAQRAGPLVEDVKHELGISGPS